MRLRAPALPFLVPCGALVAAVLVLGLATHARGRAPLPEMTLRDPGGQRVELGKLHGRVWVASFVDADCLERCPSVADRLAALHDRLPPGVPLLTFVLDGHGQWPSRPRGAEERDGWIVCQGNATDAADELAVRALATDYVRVPAERLAGLARGEPTSLAVAVDRRGRAQRVRSLLDERAVLAAVGDAELMSGLHRHPLRDAVLHALVALLLLGGTAGARFGFLRVRAYCTASAALLTTMLVASALRHVAAALSLPSQGVGWARPLYVTVLGTQGAISMAMAVLGSVLAYHAAPEGIVRHLGLARWIPAWIVAALTGTAVHLLLYVSFGGG